MRPLRLELEGFSTFRERTVIDFTDVDLVAFVGPTGAGKSSIIDGIIFALYGSVVRYRASNLVAPVVNQLSTQARVRLDFAVGDETYTAVRVVRRTTKGATTKEARLECNEQVLAGNARELDDAVEALLGLDFDQFTKTVVLPQGEFARFLTETPETRQALLRRLLGMDLYRAMGTAARERARRAETTRLALVEQREDRPEVTAEVVARAAEEFATLTELQSGIEDEVAALSTAEVELAAAIEVEAVAVEQLTQLRAVKAPSSAQRLEKSMHTLDAKMATATEAVEEAKERLANALDEADNLPAPSELEELIELHAEAAELESHIGALRIEHAEASTALHAAVTAESQAERALEEIETTRSQVLVRAGAAGLRATLALGEHCPVCDQEIESLPEHDPSAELEAIDKAVDSQRRIVEHARADRRDVEKNHARLGGELESLETRRAHAADALDSQPELKTVRKQLTAARRAATAVEKAQSKAERALATVSDLAGKRQELDNTASTLRRELTSARDRLSALDPPAPSEESITADWADLLAWKSDVIDRVTEAKSLASADVTSAKKAHAQRRSSIAKLCSTHTDETPDDPLSWVANAAGQAQARVETLEQELNAQTKTNDRIDALHTEGTVAAELGRILSARGFEQWLMADVMHTLAERATDRLLVLSGGAYSMLTNGTDFSIRDHRNADEVRGARTLSGGETFLASLSLALALADNIAELAAEGAPVIDSMFLDEGFGTLDVDTLDVVASAIEELGAEGRMIGIVTHIRELADRIPVRFEVARTPNGSTVTRTTLD